MRRRKEKKKRMKRGEFLARQRRLAAGVPDAPKGASSRKASRTMKRYQTKTLRIALRNRNENWMAAKLGSGWVRQQIAGHRIYDFFNRAKGVAIEVDGDDHEPDWDHWRDLDDWRYRRVLVIHVRNRNEEDAAKALAEIETVGEWAVRMKETPPEPMPLLPSIPARRWKRKGRGRVRRRR